MPCGEFSLIKQYFTSQPVKRKDVSTGIGDDCAILTVPEKQQVAISTDTLVSGIHFLPSISPEDLAYKALAVNISDLAAVGADPSWASLALTLPDTNSEWLEAFSRSFFALADYYAIQLIGGDTTRGPLSLTITIQGLVPQGTALLRSGAKIGDWIYVTGFLGDSAAGLAILQNRLQPTEKEHSDYFVARHLRPQPRLLQGQALRHLATSAIDISDGLISDLNHILTASGCGARLNLDALPYSPAMKAQVSEEQAEIWALSGGEDYELCFTVPEINRGALEIALAHTGADFHCIGQIMPIAEGIRYLRDGKDVHPNLKGFDHFSDVNE
ncbi:thiamine-phosphate kinase [Proteus vulgaris]|uniref:thiamine-phosphate kinase n=1 Tax=Proteus vulgaris TaxID=585 RepID=UPI0018E4A0B2|nr:thiamine-phosphate kinase [Proteus vulgaris]MBI6527737.1 thiamine-phosphate kinase [Proteus vulgaris]